MSSVQDSSDPAVIALAPATTDLKLWYAEYVVREQAGEALPS